MIDLFCDTILPGDEELGMPSGASVDVTAFISQHGADQPLEEFLSLLDTTAQNKYGDAFAKLDAEQRLACIELSKRKNLRLSISVIVMCLQAYYTDKTVLSCLPAGAVPPFPVGNVMEDDDWNILEPVFERGDIYRTVKT